MSGKNKIDWGKIKGSKNWCNFIAYCEELGYGKIYEISIQDGVPTFIRVERKSINLGKEEVRDG